MKTLEITKAEASLQECVQALGQEPVALTQEGRPVAVLVPVGEADLENIALALSPQFQAILERSARRQQAEGGLSPAEMRQLFVVEATPKTGR